MSPIPATTPLERLLDECDCYGSPATTWADGSPKPMSLIEDDWKCERARRASCQLHTEEEAGLGDGPTAVMLREYLAAADDAQEAQRVIKAAKAQRRREYGVVPPSSEVVRHAEAQKSHGRHSGAARESHGGASRTRGSRRSSSRGGDSGDSDGGSGSDEPPGLRCAAGCGNGKRSAAGQAKYCDRPSCHTARATDRQRKSRDRRTVLPPRGWELAPGPLLRPGGGVNRVNSHIQFSDDSLDLGPIEEDSTRLWLAGRQQEAEAVAVERRDALLRDLGGAAEVVSPEPAGDVVDIGILRPDEIAGLLVAFPEEVEQRWAA